MAEFKQLSLSDVIVGTGLDDDNVTLLIRNSDEMLAFPINVKMPRFKATVSKLLNVSGAADGANSAVTVEWRHFDGGSTKQQARLKETPAELRAVFAEAGFATMLPTEEKSIGYRARKVLGAIGFGPAI